MSFPEYLFTSQRSSGTPGYQKLFKDKSIVGRPVGIGLNYNPETYPLARIYGSPYRGNVLIYRPEIKPFLSPSERSQEFIHTPYNTRNPSLS